MKKTYSIQVLLFTFFLFPFCNQAQSTIENYINAEETRLIKADSINSIIESYISTNLIGYSLSQIEIEEITNDLYHVHDGSSAPIVGSDLDNVILEAKTNKLLAQYYELNPSNLSFFQPTQLSSNLKQQCFNGDFIYGYAGYVFKRRIVYPSTHMQNGCTVSNLSVNFTPTFINSFNGIATLVSPGNEPYLSSLGVYVNRTPTGSIRALKLNPTPTSYTNSQTGNQTSVSKEFIINENQISFNFLQFGHVVPGSHSQPAFRYRLIDNNSGVVLRSNCYSMDINDCRYNQVSDNIWDSNTTNILSYTPNWVCETVDTSDLIGRDVTLEFLASDCAYRGHFSTVYIANICGVMCSSTWGSLDMDPLELNCPTSDFNVCGNFQLSEGTNLTAITLNILDSSFNAIHQVTNPIITGSTYCFTVNPSDFGINPVGNYTFEVNLNNNSSCSEISTITEINGNVSFNNCIQPPDPCDLNELETQISGNYIVWTDIATAYTVEFASDGRCKDGNLLETDEGPVVSHSVTTSLTAISIPNVITIMDRRALRWRIKTECSEWSDWCCIIRSSVGFINVYEPECFPANPCEDYDDTDPMLTSPTDDIISGIINYDSYVDITASNKIEPLAESTFRASNTIVLEPGFHAKNESDFRAHIAECIFFIGNNNGNKQAINNEADKMEGNHNTLKIFPNPATQELALTINSTKLTEFQLYNIQGQLVKSNTINAFKHTINVEGLARGFYIIKVVLQDNSIIHKNIILK